jgi:hypothetical protein
MTLAMNAPVGEAAFMALYLSFVLLASRKGGKKNITLHPARSQAAWPLEFGPEILCLRYLGLVV